MGLLPSNLPAGILIGNSALEPILESIWLKRNQAPTYIERRHVILHYCSERCLMLDSCTIRYGSNSQSFFVATPLEKFAGHATHQ